MKIFVLIIAVHFAIGDLYGAAVQYLSQATPSSSFARLPYEEGHPDTYTVGCFDSSFIPPSELASMPRNLGSIDPIKKWIHKNLLEKLAADNNLPLTCTEGQTLENIRYYMVMYKKELYKTAAEKFSLELMGESTRRSRPKLSYLSSMLIFPYTAENNQALVYLFGQWQHLHNPLALVKDWGLRLAAHKKMFTETAVKSVTGKNDASANPTLRTLTKMRLDTLNTFDLEVGTEGLRSLRSLPQYTRHTDCVRLSKASDTFQIHLSDPDNESKKHRNSIVPTVDILSEYAHYFYALTQDMIIHKDLRAYIDKEVTDAELIASLNRALEQQLTDPSAHFRIFPHEWLWKTYGVGLQFKINGDTYTKYLTASWKGQTPRLDTKVYFKRPRQERDSSELLKHIIYTLPIEHEGRYYKYDRGHWIAIEESRFEAIKKKLRSSKIKQDIPVLLPFTSDDATGKGGLYAEDAYNKRIVRACNLANGPRALLLDRVNIFLKGAYDKFEFADIMLLDDEHNFSLIHVKRRTSNAIDHHRTQIERCADYLATELKKQKGEGIFFASFITSLYLHYGLPAQKKGRSNSFEKATKRISSKRTWAEVLEELLTKKGDDGEGTNELKELLASHDLSVYENEQGRFIQLLDALRDCNKHKRLTNEEVTAALEAAEQALAVHDDLLTSLADSGKRKNIRIIMAVIDDRSLSHDQEGADESKGRETELFHLQDLWGLDRTCQAVQKRGFSFVLSVVNEKKDVTRDAFGIFLEEEPLQVSSDDETSEEKKLPSQKKKTAPSHTKSRKRKSAKSMLDENGDSLVEDVGNEVESAPHDEGSQGEDHDVSASSTKRPRKEGYLSDAEEEERLVARYQYSASDVARLFHLSLREVAEDSEDYDRYSLTGAELDDDADPMTVVHRFGNRYTLPPITQHYIDRKRQSSEQACVEVLRNFYTDIAPHTPAITELIIPYNPGEHWVTLHIRIRIDEVSHERIATFVYYESLRGLSFNKFSQIRTFLRTQGYQGLFDAYERKGFIQPDGVSCGPITVETVKRLFKGEAISRAELTDADCLAYKQSHRERLQVVGYDFDF